jgi:hypothetical protein
MANKVEITVLDEDGTNENLIRVPETMTIETFVNQLKEGLKIPKDAQYDAVLMRTKSILKKGQTIKQAGIEMGDIIKLRHTGEGGCFTNG